MNAIDLIAIHSNNAITICKIIQHLGNLRRRRYKYMVKMRTLHNKLCMLLLLVAENSSPIRRSIWMKPRSKLFWEHDCQINDDRFFKENFRMSRECFEALCVLLPNLEKQDTNMRAAIPLKKRVAIGLYALGSSAEYRTIANMFGVGKSTVGKILLDFCHEAWVVLVPLYLKDFPLTKDKIEENTKGFERMGFPQCLGAIDGCHIEIRPHGKDAVDYYNYKRWYSTVLLALVDYRYRFMYVNVGTPGRSNDSSIYEKSFLKREIENCNLIKAMSRNFSNVSVPVCILGDSAFKLSSNLMKPYPYSTDLSEKQKLFNYKLAKCRRVVENGFGHLKARFRRIGKGIDNEIDNTNAIIKACCVLHNYLSEHNDNINKTWIDELGTVEQNRVYPTSTSFLGETNANAQQIRNAIASFIEDGCGGEATFSGEVQVGQSSLELSEFGDGCGVGTVDAHMDDDDDDYVDGMP